MGASYLTAGHIYATDCKRGLPPRGLGFLKEVCREVSIPVYGIGGIKFDEEQWNDMKKMWSSWRMCYVRNDGNIVIEIKQLIFKEQESLLSRYSEGFCFALAYKCISDSTLQNYF